MNSQSQPKSNPNNSTTGILSGKNPSTDKQKQLPINFSSTQSNPSNASQKQNFQKLEFKNQLDSELSDEQQESSLMSLQPLSNQYPPRKPYLPLIKNQNNNQQSKEQTFNPYFYDQNVLDTIDQELQNCLRQRQQQENRIRSQKERQQAIKRGENPDKKRLQTKVRKTKVRITQKMLRYIQQFFFKYEVQDRQGIRKKHSLTRLSYQTGCSKSTIYKLYRNFLLDNTMTQQFIMVKDDDKTKSLNETTQRRIAKLKEILQENPFLTQGQMTQHLRSDQYTNGNGKGLHRSNISKLLKSIKYSKKKVIPIPKYRNVPQNIEKRYKYCAFYKQAMSKNRGCALFLDECGFNFFSIRDSAWSSVGKPIQTKVQFPKGTNVSIMAIMSVHGIVAWQIKKGNFKREQNLNFIQKYISKASRQQNKKKQYLILDNCKIHDPQQTKIISQNSGIVEILYLPPYSPQLNPIQHWFHQLKCNVRKTTFNTQEQLMVEVNNVVKRYREYDFSNYYNSVDKHCERGLNRQNF